MARGWTAGRSNSFDRSKMFVAISTMPKTPLSAVSATETPSHRLPNRGQSSSVIKTAQRYH